MASRLPTSIASPFDRSTPTSMAIAAQSPNRVLGVKPPMISTSERWLPRAHHTTLSQLHSGFPLAMRDYQHRIGAEPSLECPECVDPWYLVPHLFSCPARPTDLTVGDMWERPLEVAHSLLSAPSFSHLPELPPSWNRPPPRPRQMRWKQEQRPPFWQLSLTVPVPDWKTVLVVGKGLRLFHFKQDNFLSQWVPEPTKVAHVLDLIFTTECNLVSELVVGEYLTLVHRSWGNGTNGTWDELITTVFDVICLSRLALKKALLKC